MCGIAGLIRWPRIDPDEEKFAPVMARLLEHRGPDGWGNFVSANALLVQARLSLRGPMQCRLPVQSADGRYTIVYNGEVYNLPDDSSSGDTAAVLAAWITSGEQSLHRLNGMFAFFIWDSLAQRGYAACDTLGIKPLFYYSDGGRFVFASEAGALIESGAVPFAPDEEAIAESLVAPYFSGASNPPFRGIHRLAPGHWLSVDRNGLRIERYSRFCNAKQTTRGADELIDELAGTIDSAISRSMRATSRIGIFLSGGVDSSLIASVASRHSEHPIPAWTIAYSDQDRADYATSLIVRSDDVPFARQVAAEYACDHRIVEPGPCLYESALLRTLRKNDLIAAWEQEISQQLLAEAASHTVKAVLVGDAADETQFGYSFLLNPNRVASPCRLMDYFGVAPVNPKLLSNPAAHFTRKYEQFAVDQGYSWRAEADQRLAMSCLIQNFWLTRLLHNGDIHLMAHSVEGRVPFGDIELLRCAAAVSQELGFRDGIEKWHLRKAAERYLHSSIAWRPKSALTKNLMANEVIHRRFAEAWRQRGALIEPYVDADAVEAIANAGVPRTEVETGIRFRLLSLMTWFDRFAGAAT